MDSEYTRSGPRRLGDDYQDVVALETITAFLEHKNRYQYIQVEAPDKGSLDDVVAVREDGSFELKQVKFSVDPDNEDCAWTWNKLTEKDKNKKSLIEKWASSYERIKRQGKISAASVESNRKSDEIQGILDAQRHVLLDKISDKATRSKIIEQIGNEDRAKEFFSVFCFNLDRPSLTELEEMVKKRFIQIGLNEENWKNLKSELRSWACEKNKPAPDGRITYERIQEAVQWHKLREIEEKFPIPSDFVVPSEKFHEILLSDLRDLRTGCIVVTAAPGMGKSTYLSYLYGQLELAGIPVIRHHYHISESDRTVGRYNPEIIAESLMGEISSKYSDFVGEWKNKNATFRELSSWLEICGQELRKKEKSLIMIIDGLDNAWREKQSSVELTDLFEHILPTPEGVVVIIGTQPIDDQRLPSRLLEAVPRAKWRQLPPLDVKAVRKWIGYHEDKISLPNDMYKENILNRLAEAFHEKSGGLPLYLHYAMEKIRYQRQDISFDTIDNLPGCPHDGANGYYNIMLRSLNDEDKQILYLLTICPFHWNQNEIVECLDPEGRKTSLVIRSVREIKYLMREDLSGLSLFHDSLRVFLKNQNDFSTYSSSLKPVVIEWLDRKAPEVVKWEYLWLIKAEIGDEEPLLNGPNRKWVVNAISKSFPRNGISQILSKSALVALRRGNIARVVEIGFLLDYFNSVFERDSESIENLFFAQLVINDDPSFTNSINSTISASTNKELLYFSEHNKKNQALVKNCMNELFERQEGNRYGEYKEDYFRWHSLINSYIRTAAFYKETDLKAFLDLLIKAESTGVPDALEIFCKSLQKNRESLRLRKLLTLPMPKKNFDVVLKYAILLSFEEGFDLSNEVKGSSTNPFAAIYAFMRGLIGYSVSSIEFPSTTFFDLFETEPYSKKDELVHTIYNLFFIFSANCLWNNSKRNDDWIEQIHNYWIKGIATTLNETAKELPHLIRTRSQISLDWLFTKVNSLRRPTWPTDRHYAVYGDCVEEAAIPIALDLISIVAAAGKKPEIKGAELENALSTQYFDPWKWIDALVSIERDWLSQDALDWARNRLESGINSSISTFSERAINYSRLAALFALHDDKEYAKIYVEASADNLLAYGDHKDVTLFLVLDALELCYNAKVNETKKWLIRTTPAILWVKKFTDGDETRHLPRELGNVIAKYEPSLLSSYYNWLVEQEDYYNAEALIHSFIKNGDLSDPINRALAETAIDEESLTLLYERAKTQKDAKIVLSSITKIVGKNAILIANRKKAEGEQHNKSNYGNFEKEGLPNPECFPPEKFEEYLRTVRSKGYFSNSIEHWIRYWKNTQQSVSAYNSIKKEVDKGTILDEYDSLFDLALLVVGKEEAYNWLVKAQVRHFGWNPFTDRTTLEKRWEIIKKYYVNQWSEFIKDTLEPMFSERWKFVSAHIFSRLVEYCFYMQKAELAKAISLQAVISTSELVSPLMLPKPKWVIENE
jgi:hypothetical protein